MVGKTRHMKTKTELIESTRDVAPFQLFMDDRVKFEQLFYGG